LKELIRKDFIVSEHEKDEFVALTKRLIDVMTEFSLLTLRAFIRRKQSPLSETQIDDIINFDLQFRIQQIQDPEFLDIIRERVVDQFSDEEINDTSN
jgi:hypothetical protein